ncbi:MAG: hypothetical protein ACR2LI_06030 [Propionibacteriaceae bacterium]
MRTTTTPATVVPGNRLHPAARLSTPLRVAAATTLVLGTGLHAAAWLVYAQPNLTTTYTSVAAGAVRPDLSTALFILGIPFWIASVAVYVLLGRSRSPRLAWTGGALLVVGFTMLAANLGTEIMTSFLARQATIAPAQAAEATRTLASLPATVMNLLFLIGVVVGIPLTAVSLWRSRAVPRTAAALLVVFLALDLAGESTIAALSVIAHVIAVIPAGWIAITVLRVPPLRPPRTAGDPMTP